MNTFFDSSAYWETRYKNKGNSGAGSYGKLATFKADFINKFVFAHKIETVIEWGCGDGNQLSLAKYPSYSGVDVSPAALQVCKERFTGDASKQFLTTDQAIQQVKKSYFDLAISLDVIFHLVEEDVYDRYMQDLFNSAQKWVIIYSSNSQDLVDDANHVKHRHFTKWVEEHEGKKWSLRSIMKNIYPWDTHRKTSTTFSDFYIFESKM